MSAKEKNGGELKLEEHMDIATKIGHHTSDDTDSTVEDAHAPMLAAYIASDSSQWQALLHPVAFSEVTSDSVINRFLGQSAKEGGGLP